MFSFLNKPFPFFLNDRNRNIILISFSSLFVFLFLTFYTPFKSSNTLADNVLWSILCFIIIYLNIILLPKLLPALFDLSEWTAFKYIVFCVWLFLSLGVLLSVFNWLFYCSDLNLINVWLKTQREVVLTGIIPLIVCTIVAKNELLKQNLHDAVDINKKLREIHGIKESVKKLEEVTLSTDTSETFRFKITDLVYVAAVDNYSETFLKSGSSITPKLLRVSLSSVEKQLHNRFIVRCHRSYIINVREIQSITGNTNGYKLQLKNVETEIPVSRAKGKEIMKQIQDIRDLMDFA